MNIKNRLTFYFVLSLIFAIIIGVGVYLYQMESTKEISEEFFWYLKSIMGVAIAAMNIFLANIINVNKAEHDNNGVRIHGTKDTTLLEKESKYVSLSAAAIFIAIMVL